MPGRVGEQYGNYRLVKKLGEGKTGEVYLGEQLALNTPVALRLLPTSGAPEEREHLLAEASRIAALDHPHLVKLLDAFILDDLLVLVSRYTPHGNLLQHHPKGSQLPLERILPYVRDCASALDYLHEQGLLHLDVKPENLLLGLLGEVWLSNVGLGLLLQPRKRDGAPAAFIGTPLYAAPEQFQGEPGPASDQYALAMTVYCWLAGKLPWQGDLAAIAAQKRRGPPPIGPLFPPIWRAEQEAREHYERGLAVSEQMEQHLSRNRKLPPGADEELYGSPPREPAPWIPPDVESVILRALAPNPADRFESVSAFAEALALASQPPLASSPAPGTTLFTYHENSSLFSVAWSPNGRQIASMGLNNMVQVWDATIGRRLAAFPGGMRVAWSPDGRRIATAGGMGALAVWAVAPAHKLLVCQGQFRIASAVAWSPDGRFIAASGDSGMVHIWEVATGECVLTYHSHAHNLPGLAWSPNGRWIASGGSQKTEQGWEGIIHVWDAATGEHLFACHGHAHGVTSLAWSPDSSRFASAGADGIFHLWDAVTGANLPTSIGQGTVVMSVAWSPDGKRIVTGGGARRQSPHEREPSPVKVWDVATGDCLLTYSGHYTPFLHAVAWSPDGTRVVSAGNLNARVWWAG